MELIERAALKLLRLASPRWKAHTDLFVEPYRQWLEWNSGLGDGGRVLYALTRMVKPKTIVEIGSARGTSTCSFALACAENGGGKVYAIDPHFENEWTDVGTAGRTLDFLRARITEYKLEPFCEVVRSTSQDAAKNWDRPIDLLFIDGDHSLEAVRADFELFLPWVNKDGLVLFHDSGWDYEGPWERFKNESWFRPDMGVPAYLQALKGRGYQAVTFMPVPGMTVMHPEPGGFDYLRGRGLPEEAFARK